MPKTRLAVDRRSACSGVKALRNTSDARRQAAKLCYRFGPLTPSARSANLIVGDGTKNGFPSSEQKTGENQKRPLDTKSPIQVRIELPSSGSFQQTLGPSRRRPIGVFSLELLLKGLPIKNRHLPRFRAETFAHQAACP